MTEFSSDEKRAQAAVRELDVAPADPEYRFRLERVFVDGSIEGRRPGAARDNTLGGAATDAGIVSGADSRTDSPTNPRTDSQTDSQTDSRTDSHSSLPATVARRRARWLRRPVGFALAAAAVATVLFTLIQFRGNEGPWQIVEVTGSGTVWIDGRPVSSADLRGSDLAGGAQIALDANVVLEVVADHRYALEIIPGSTVTLPTSTSPGHDVCRVDTGMARFVTGSEFSGTELSVSTLDAEVLVHGTTFSVMADHEKTCVSVYEGEVEVRHMNGAVLPVPAGDCRTIPRRRGGDVVVDPLNAIQRVNLGRWHDRSGLHFAAAR